MSLCTGLICWSITTTAQGSIEKLGMDWKGWLLYIANNNYCCLLIFIVMKDFITSPVLWLTTHTCVCSCVLLIHPRPLMIVLGIQWSWPYWRSLQYKVAQGLDKKFCPWVKFHVYYGNTVMPYLRNLNHTLYGDMNSASCLFLWNTS